MHQAGHVGGRQHLGAGLLVVAQAIQSHQRRHRLLVDGERAAKAAALVGPAQLRQLDAVQRREQLADLVERRHHDLAGLAQPQAAKPVAAVVQADAVRERALDPLDLQHVDQELAQLERLAASVPRSPAGRPGSSS